MTLLELLNATAGYFEKHGVPQPRLNAELLIADALGLKRLDIYLQFDRPIADSERDRLRPLARRRAQREPLQHVMGWTEFCGVRLASDGRALVPRPETECLVEEALRRATETGILLDIGTGTGAIALAFLARRPAWNAVATDISKDALDLARANADALGLAGRITFVETDIWPPGEGMRFAMVTANPPYIASRILPCVSPEVRADPVLALDGGPDGLGLIRRIIAGAPAHLDPGGSLLIEIGDDQGPAVKDLLVAAGLAEPAILPDLNGRDRVAAARRAPHPQ